MCVHVVRAVDSGQRTSYGAFVTLDERLPGYELVKDRRGERTGTAHGCDSHLLLKGEWYGHWKKGIRRDPSTKVFLIMC
jgi:hypothetical protein